MVFIIIIIIIGRVDYYKDLIQSENVSIWNCNFNITF